MLVNCLLNVFANCVGEVNALSLKVMVFFLGFLLASLCNDFQRVCVVCLSSVCLGVPFICQICVFV